MVPRSVTPLAPHFQNLNFLETFKSSIAKTIDAILLIIVTPKSHTKTHNRIKTDTNWKEKNNKEIDIYLV